MKIPPPESPGGGRSFEKCLPLWESGCPLGQTDEGVVGSIVFACRGGGMPRPLEFHTPNRQSVRLPLEGGAPRSESKIYMTAGGSHTSTTLAQRQLRLMRSKRSTITMGWYKIATFDLIRHGLWPVTPSPPGEGFFLSRQPLRRFLPLKYRYQAGGACRPYNAPPGAVFTPSRFLR